jgi:hypothetical protein
MGTRIADAIMVYSDDSDDSMLLDEEPNERLLLRVM